MFRRQRPWKKTEYQTLILAFLRTKNSTKNKHHNSFKASVVRRFLLQLKLVWEPIFIPTVISTTTMFFLNRYAFFGTQTARSFCSFRTTKCPSFLIYHADSFSTTSIITRKYVQYRQYPFFSSRRFNKSVLHLKNYFPWEWLHSRQFLLDILRGGVFVWTCTTGQRWKISNLLRCESLFLSL